ncbi:hypothetical protein C5F47_05280 [Nitrosopumilus cobalaminigenes]|uniref:Uncharacterized protein n=1 Tax=Nitrosopumilus cobalaminigenes TaxID=1470066 RepID=A0A7D5R7X4_9ARCH|nr:hypothetical protein [Nitrosopumilus cobalaminigenes]QLH03001.1 hypothetical protein C5F47_05280 [Nitrosopumilus cobalaminigenes]
MATKQDLLDQLQALKIFPNTKLVKELRFQIKKKLEKIDRKQKPLIKKRKANLTRSGKLRRYHNYIRQIRNNFPGLKYNQIRSQLSQRRRGNQVSIPDAIWQNPSP